MADDNKDKKPDMKKDEEKKDDAPDVAKGDAAETRELLGTVVKLLKQSNDRQQRLELRLRKAEKYIQDDAEKAKGGVDHDPSDDNEDNKPSSESAAKPAKDTTSTAGSFTKGHAAAPVGAAPDLVKWQEETVKKAVDAAKAATPMPFGYTQEQAALAADPFSLIAKAVTESRKNAGHYSAGGDSEHVRDVLFVKKMAGITEV